LGGDREGPDTGAVADGPSLLGNLGGRMEGIQRKRKEDVLLLKKAHLIREGKSTAGEKKGMRTIRKRCYARFNRVEP